jgi:low affinity Fe/Cu permease
MRGSDQAMAGGCLITFAPRQEPIFGTRFLKPHCVIKAVLEHGEFMVLNRIFTKIADDTARLSGLPVTFIACCVLIVIWAATGPLLHFSEMWMLVVSTGTSIVTFLMVFLIQSNQNRHIDALQLKLDELIVSSEAKNDFAGIERLTHAEAEEFRDHIGRHQWHEKGKPRGTTIVSAPPSGCR